MKKLTAILSVFLMTIVFQSLVLAETKTNFTPKKKHAAGTATAPAAEAPANPVAAVAAPVAQVVTPVAEAVGQVAQGITEPVAAAFQATPAPAAS